MPLVTGQEILARAQRGGYAVAAFNVITLEVLQGVIDAADEERAPVYVQFNPANLRHVELAYAAALGQAAAAQATVPVVLHLDHGENFTQAIACLRAGFTSLMYDGNAVSLEQNIATTKQVKEAAAAVGVPVEGEIGRIAGREEEINVAPEEVELTDPDIARKYVECTGVDSLAVAVGNVHGQTTRVARLDLERLRAIRAAVSAPLVLHGTSGLPDDQVRAAIELGVCKFNVATQLNQGYLRAMAGAGETAPQELRSLLMAARRAVKMAAQERIRQFGCAGRA